MWSKPSSLSGIFVFSLYICLCNPFINVLQDCEIKICLTPLESLSLELTALTRSLMAGCLCLTLTLNPAFCKILKSVLPPALVLRCLEAGSG